MLKFVLQQRLDRTWYWMLYDEQGQTLGAGTNHHRARKSVESEIRQLCAVIRFGGDDAVRIERLDASR